MEGDTQRPMFGPSPPNTKFVLCFDGTGNKFSGTPADSNILKIFRMLDAADPNYHVYYQPGIGTYVQSTTYSHTSFFTKTYSWVQKTRDSMIGSSFDQHLMAGYKFLMRYYKAGDDIYIFGFSRGAYTARFLAQMLDMVGLLPAGNEEMARFAFKAFARWQRRLDGTEEEKKEKKAMYEYMSAFRDTFSRPVRRIRFLGVFDTVNSVPRFEARFMKRSKFPYTARSSALVIRHAVSIDERRAKFRQDLLGETKPSRKTTIHTTVDRAATGLHHDMRKVEQHRESDQMSQRFRRPSVNPNYARPASRSRERSPSDMPRQVWSAEGTSGDGRFANDQQSVVTDTASQISYVPPRQIARDYYEDEEEETPSDVQELWFPGCHADIGGGWPLDSGEEYPLSHAPLVWMVREAQKAGLRFRENVMKDLKVMDEDRDATIDAHDYAYENNGTNQAVLNTVPELKIEQPSPPIDRSRTLYGDSSVSDASDKPKKHKVHETLQLSAELGRLHDCLRFGQGTPHLGVIGWRIMEWLPFARMDLQPDNSWKAIRFPLPRGEVRDIPDSALIHTSALKRMKADPAYRPGNLVIGGGGRGIVIAPAKYGIGNWEVVREEGNPVGEAMVRRRLEGEQNNSQTEKGQGKGTIS